MNQTTPLGSLNSSPNAKSQQAKSHPAPELQWWNLLPLAQETRYTAAIHWTPQGIVTAHPTKPAILLYPHPPSTSDRKIFPTEGTLIRADTFGPASVLSVSGSGERVFAYFPLANGANAGVWCLWINMILRASETVEKGEAVVGCWWLGETRQIITEDDGSTTRLPALGPRVAFNTWMALILTESFTLHLITDTNEVNKKENAVNRININALRKGLHSSPQRNSSMDTWTGHVCIAAALGLAYSESSMILAMQSTLLPTARVAIQESQPMGISMSSASFFPQSNINDWEPTGIDTTIRLCEIALKYAEKGWDLQVHPLSSIPIPTPGELSHLHFLPRSPNQENNMSVDGKLSGDRYLVIATADFGDYSSLPTTSLSLYTIARHEKSISDLSHRWESTLETTRTLSRQSVTALSNAWPSKAGQGLLVSLSRDINSMDDEKCEELKLLQLPGLEDDERYTTAALHAYDVPSQIATSPQGTQLVLQSLNSPTHLGFHPYPVLNTDAQDITLRDAMLQTLLSCQDIDDMMRFIPNKDKAYRLDLIESVWDKLDPKVGGGSARWLVEYLRAILLIDKTTPDENKDNIENRIKASIDILSLLVARSAFIEGHNKNSIAGVEGAYDPDLVWPLSDICSWTVEVTERILSAANNYQNASQSGFSPSNVDPIVFLLLERSLLQSWLDTIEGATTFLGYVVKPPGTSSDNKVLVTKAVEDVMNQSPVNFSLLLEALKSLITELPEFSSAWRKGYRNMQVPESLSEKITVVINKILTPEVVSLLPLHVRMAGLSLFSSEDMRQERDIITKKRLGENDWREMSHRATCKRCGGKTVVDLKRVPGTGRWRAWETSFERCICGGQWKVMH